jgi:hypothetical protein
MQNHALYWIANLLVLICVPIFVLRYWAKEASRLGRRRIKLTSPSRFAPARAARERRELVRTFLSTERNRFQSFIETPPDIEAQAENLDSLVPTEIEQSWQLSRLELQLASDRTLLAERVTDALVSYHRVGRIKSEDFPLSIQLEPRKSQRGLYPWSAVIVVERADSIIRCLTPITEWLGIGVEVLETRQRTRAEGGERREDGDSVSTIPQGRCSVGHDGLEGTVGGLIMTESEPGLGVTCRHVLSDHCGSSHRES